jgi:hypothetical protein
MKVDGTSVGSIEAGDEVEQCGLAGTIGTNNTLYLPSGYRKTHLSNGMNATKRFGNVIRFEKRCIYFFCHCHSSHNSVAKYPDPKDRALGCRKWQAQGLRHRAQGKNNNKKLIFSFRLAPYALCRTSWSGKTIEI